MPRARREADGDPTPGDARELVRLVGRVGPDPHDPLRPQPHRVHGARRRTGCRPGRVGAVRHVARAHVLGSPRSLRRGADARDRGTPLPPAAVYLGGPGARRRATVGASFRMGSPPFSSSPNSSRRASTPPSTARRPGWTTTTRPSFDSRAGPSAPSRERPAFPSAARPSSTSGSTERTGMLLLDVEEGTRTPLAPAPRRIRQTSAGWAAEPATVPTPPARR